MFANYYGLLLNFEQNKNSWVVQKCLGCDFILILLDKVGFVKNMWLKSEKKIEINLKKIIYPNCIHIYPYFT